MWQRCAGISIIKGRLLTCPPALYKNLKRAERRVFFCWVSPVSGKKCYSKKRNLDSPVIVDCAHPFYFMGEYSVSVCLKSQSIIWPLLLVCVMKKRNTLTYLSSPIDKMTKSIEGRVDGVSHPTVVVSINTSNSSLLLPPESWKFDW